MNSTDSRRGNERARPSCLPDPSPSPSFAPSRGRRVSLGGGSFSSHVTEKWTKGASARHFPSLWHSHSWLCSSLHTWRLLRLRPSRREPHPSFTFPDGLRDEAVRLRRETLCSIPRILRDISCRETGLEILQPVASRGRHGSWR